MGYEIWLTRHQTVGVKSEIKSIEVPILQYWPRSLAGTDTADQPKTTPAPKDQPEKDKKPPIRTLPEPRNPDRPPMPKPAPGVMALVTFAGDGRIRALNFGNTRDLANKAFLETLVPLEELYLPRPALRHRILRYRNSGYVRARKGQITLYVKVSARPGEHISLPDLDSIIRDPVYGVRSIRLVHVPDKD